MPQNRRFVLASRPSGPVDARELPPRNRRHAGRSPTASSWCATTTSRSIRTCAAAWTRASSYAASQPLDETMIGGTVGEVVESRHPRFAAGDQVVAYARLAGVRRQRRHGRATRPTPTHLPLSAYLGSVGMPGVTAWYGLNRIIAPKAGETVRRCPRRAARSARWSASSRSSPAAARSASPAARRSARTWPTNWASTPASTTSATTSARRSRRARPTASTVTSRTSAARSSTPCCRA